MRVTTYAEFDICTGFLLSRKWTWHTGKVALCKGASAAEQSIAGQQAAFFQTLQSSYSQIFAEQQGFMQSLNSQYGSILAAGPGQFGYNAQEEASLRGSAAAQTAGDFQNAQAALQQRLAMQGGQGAAAAPSGTAAQMEAVLGAGSAQEQAQAQNTITQQGYAQGNQNFWKAAEGMGNLVSAANPTPYASAATSAGRAAFGSAETVQKQNEAGSFGAIAGGILGDVAGSFIGDPTLGNQIVGSSIGPSGSSGGGGVGGGWTGGAAYQNSNYNDMMSKGNNLVH